jgi:preprotein translocase SecE subunit
MARPSRTRRGKRSADYQAPAAPTRRERRPPQQVRPTQQSKSQSGAQRERRGGFRSFVGESYAELRKVEWPTQRQLLSATVVVIIAIGAYLAAADFVFSRFVRDVLLRGV